MKFAKSIMILYGRLWSRSEKKREAQEPPVHL